MNYEPFGNRYNAARDSALQVKNAGNGAQVYPSSDPRLVELFGGPPSSSGVWISAETALCVAAVYACVSRIAGGVSTLPCNVYERTWDTKRQRFISREVEDAPLWWLLNEQPAPAWTGAAHWEQLITHRLLRGDHFTEIRRSASGAISELVPMPWTSVTPLRLSLDVGSRLMYSVNDGLRVRGVDQDDMLHFPGFGFDGVRGRSVIYQAARNAAGNALAMDQYAGKFFANGAHPSTVLESDRKMSPALIEELQAEFARKYSGLPNAHALPLILTEGLKAKSVSINAEDAQLLEARKFQVVDVARAFGVPPHMIGETSASTTWGSGLESMGRAFVTFTLAPHLAVIQQELNRKLYRTTKRFVAFDMSGLLEGDLAAQAAFYRAALGGPGTGKGWMSVNDVRNARNLPPLANEDDIFTPNAVQTPAPKPTEGNA